MKKLDTNKVYVNFTMPVFNRYFATQKSLLELRKTETSINYKITVVDNGSDEKLVNKLKEFYSIGIIDKLFLLQKNMGIACACNIGWKMTPADFYCKIDNDTMPISRDWLTRLFSLWSHGDKYSNIGYAENTKILCSNPNYIKSSDGILGICDSTLAGTGIFIPKIVSDVLGYWNDEYGLYGAEDGDYGVRMRYLNIIQYYYLRESFIRYDLDKLDDAQYLDHGLDKSKELDSFKKNSKGYFGRFGLNSYLFNYNIRTPKVCQKYEIDDIDNNIVHLRENKRYKLVNKALEVCSDLLMNAHKSYGEGGLYNPVIIEKMKSIMKDCGEDVDTFSKNLEVMTASIP